MGTVLRGGTLVEFEPASVEVADLRIVNERIVARGKDLPAEPGDEVIALSGKVVLPGLVSAHHHLSRVLGRGRRPFGPPLTHEERLHQERWPFERALNADAVQIAGTVGALEALQSGTTTIFDHHSSPGAIKDSLTRLARGMNEVGVRGVLSYAASDHWGALGREEGIEESVTFSKKARGRFRGRIGASAASMLSDEALEGIREAVASTRVGVQLELAEDPWDERVSTERHGDAPVARLLKAGLIGASSLIAHAVHLSWPELAQVLGTGAWLVHVPRANMEAEAGYAPAGKFGARATLGSAGLPADLFAEVQLAYLRSREAGQPIDVLRYLANGQRLASEAFGDRLGELKEGAVADLAILDYRPPTPLTTETLAAHVVFGLSARLVENVMVDGTWRLWARRPLSVNPDAVAEEARTLAADVWSRAAEQKDAQRRSSGA